MATRDVILSSHLLKEWHRPGPAAQDIFATRGENVIFPVPLWPYLAVAALLLYMVDVFLRRIRLQ